MSSLSKILKPVAAVAGVVAAPFTGGASLAITAGMLSSMANDSSQAQAQKAANAAADQQTQAAVAAQEKIIADQTAAAQTLNANSTTAQMQTYYDQKIAALSAQVSNATAAAQNNAVQRDSIQMNTRTEAPNYLPYILGGVVVIGGLIWWFKFRK